MPASLAAIVFSAFFLGSLLVIAYFEERENRHHEH